MAPSISSTKTGDSTPSHPIHHPGIYPLLVPARITDPLISAISGAIAGLASGIIVCPLDVIKTKLQAQGGFSSMRKRLAPHGHGVGSAAIGRGMADRATMGGRVLAYRGLVGTARTIWTEEGVRGMYRGLGPLILGYLPTWTVYFTVYEKSKDVLGNRKFGLVYLQPSGIYGLYIHVRGLTVDMKNSVVQLGSPIPYPQWQLVPRQPSSRIQSG